MTQSLRILSYNTQLRSWAMEVGWPPSIPPVDTAEDRAGFIADNILTSPFDYDLVGLCEVFDEDARDVLRGRLRARYPHVVTKCDWDYMQVDTAGGEQTLGLLAQWQMLGVPAVDSSWRLEDSGLMIFSKWPFAALSTAGLDPAVKAAVELLGYPVPASVPAVNFLPYEDTAGNDGNAAKGVAYARIERGPGQTYHLFFSHTQADSKFVEEHRDARSQQMAKVEKFIDLCTGGAPFADEVFFMGDLNIFGEQAANAVDGKEWKTDFDFLGRLLSDHAIDLWGRRQCVGEPGLRDHGFSATVSYAPKQQRLDYMFGSASSGLAAQHLMIDYDLADVPAGHPEVSYLSDHRPLRLELARPRAHSTPAGAFAVPEDPAVFTSGEEWLIEGQAMWFLFTRAGTYDFALAQQSDQIAYEVYLDTDLSRRREQYRKEKHPDFGDKFVIAAPPFLVKVFPKSRNGEAWFRFRAHRHEGIAPWDAIQLPYGETVPEAFPPGQLLNTDLGATDWDDADTKWFRLDAPQIPLDDPLGATVTVRRTRGEAPFAVALAREEPPGTFTLLEHTRTDVVDVVLTLQLNKDEKIYVQVIRDDQPALRDLEFTVSAATDVTLVLGRSHGAPRLMCTQETGGWGADDIELGITADGKEIVYIDNDAIGDFEQDAIRDLNQWVPQFLPYRDGIEFMVKELDDIGHDDIGRETLRPFAGLAGWDRFDVSDRISPGRWHGFLRVDVDDGRYDVELTVTTWDEQF